MLGTHGYIAPEFYLGVQEENMQKKLDVWALGCIIH
jgi:serine/threonine protein kinase